MGAPVSVMVAPTDPRETKPATLAQYETVLGWALFLTFAAWTAFKVFTHVPWRDELQALLIAREAPSITGLLHNLSHEGHPGLWHLILFGATRFSGDPAILPWLQAPIALGLLALVWFASPFGMLEKLLLSASYYVSFEYGVLARSYGLGVVLFFCVIVLRYSAWSWVMLGLMANISIHFMALGGIMGLLLLWRGQRSPVGISLCLGLVAIAISTAWPAADMLPPVPQPPWFDVRLLWSLEQMSAALMPISITFGSEKYWDALLYEAGHLGLVSLGALTAILAIASLWRSWVLASALGLLYASLLAVGALLFTGYNRHYGLIFLCWSAFTGLPGKRARGAPSY